MQSLTCCHLFTLIFHFVNIFQIQNGVSLMNGGNAKKQTKSNILGEGETDFVA